MPVRWVYYSGQWENDFNGLPEGRGRRGLTADPAIRDWVIGFLDRYVDGEPVGRLIRPGGFAMHPAFRRMRTPWDQVVEMRTRQTRTFGFFAKDRSYVAHRIVLTDALKDGHRTMDAAYDDVARGVLTFWLEGKALDPNEIDRTSDVDSFI